MPIESRAVQAVAKKHSLNIVKTLRRDLEKHQDLEWINNFPISDTNETLNSSQVASLTQYTKNGSMEFLVKETNLVWIICESRIEVINFHDQVAIDVYFIFVNLGHTVYVRLIDAPNSSWLRSSLRGQQFCKLMVVYPSNPTHGFAT